MTYNTTIRESKSLLECQNTINMTNICNFTYTGSSNKKKTSATKILITVWVFNESQSNLILLIFSYICIFIYNIKRFDKELPKLQDVTKNLAILCSRNFDEKIVKISRIWEKLVGPFIIKIDGKLYIPCSLMFRWIANRLYFINIYWLR